MVKLLDEDSENIGEGVLDDFLYTLLLTRVNN